jgi:hypothetical protein
MLDIFYYHHEISTSLGNLTPLVPLSFQERGRNRKEGLRPLLNTPVKTRD